MVKGNGIRTVLYDSYHEHFPHPSRIAGFEGQFRGGVLRCGFPSARFCIRSNQRILQYCSTYISCVGQPLPPGRTATLRRCAQGPGQSLQGHTASTASRRQCGHEPVAGVVAVLSSLLLLLLRPLLLIITIMSLPWPSLIAGQSVTT